jgi:hypothetical protein
MITISIVRGPRRRIESFAVSGHAGYDDPGRDIVCAGVSAVTVGAVNAIEKLTGIVPEAEMRSGFLTAKMPRDADPALSDRAQLLLEGMVVALEAIVEQYGKYVQIQDEIAQEGG